jgi:hypothetical protein
MPQHPLVGLFLAHANDREVSPHRPVPPMHLCDRRWRFSCECGSTYHATGDAVWRQEGWRSPRKQCVICHAWNDGHAVN